MNDHDLDDYFDSKDARRRWVLFGIVVAIGALIFIVT